MTKRQKVYQEYLKSDEWITLRDAVLERDSRTCQECGGHDNLQVHHLWYTADLSETVLKQLVTLCKQCHRIEHGLPVRFEFDDIYCKLRDRMAMTGEVPTKEQEQLIVRSIRSDSDRYNAAALFRFASISRMEDFVWTRWLKNPERTRLKLFPWSVKKLERIENELKGKL